jgi:adenylyltransferase/sulfurtransferase
MQAFNQSELLRYERHFPVIGIDGQQRLKQAKVLCVGAGGLGCPALQYLAAAGVGTLGVMDADTIELSNLQRQILFYEKDVGRNKAEVVAERLQALNSQITVHAYPEFLTSANASQLIKNYDVVLDATDNYQARYLLNTVCRDLKKPLISASIYQFDAQLSVFNYKDGPCYQCLYPEPPPAALTPNCAIGGVLGVLPGVAGTIQATEALKVILDLGETLSGTLLSLDLLTMRFNQFEIEKQDCAYHPMVSFDVKETSTITSINALQLSELLANGEQSIQLIDVREAYERSICNIGGEHVPLSLFESNIERFSKDKMTVIYCKSGGRSAKACQTLMNAGFSQIATLEKGILGWIDSVDPGLMKY